MGIPFRGARRNKFNAVKTVVDGHRFDSKKEARRYGELVLLQRAGEICGLELQPAFPLAVNGVKVGTYRGDFRYTLCATGEAVVEDAKGVRTPVYKLKKALVKALYGIDVREV